MARPAVGSSEWWRQQSTPRREPLSVARIVTAALALVDAEGIEALTMRRVADRLGVAAPSLYRHVENRDALVLHMCEAIMGEVDLHVTKAPWPEQAAQLARSTRAAMTRHPGASSLFLGSGTLGPNSLAALDAGLRVCLDAGFPEDLALAACQAIGFLVRSFAIIEASGIDPIVIAPGMLTATDDDQLSAIREVADDITGAGQDANDLFEFFLQATINQLELRLTTRAG